MIGINISKKVSKKVAQSQQLCYNMDMDTEKIVNQLDDIYGPGKGMEVYMTIMPGILADFDRMLGKSKGAKVTEEYRLEDGKGALYVTGRRSANGQADIEVDVRRMF